MRLDKLKLVNNLYYVVDTSTYRGNASEIADTAASGHYLKAESPRELVSLPVAPIQVKQPNVQILHSTKVCRLELATLSEEAREAQTPPGLSHISLMSIGKLCDAGCESSFNQNNMVVTEDEEVLLQGTRGPIQGLWRVPLQILDRPTNLSNHLRGVNGKDNSIK